MHLSMLWQADKQSLITKRLTEITALQLDDAVRTADQDQDDGHEQERQEDLDPGRDAPPGGSRRGPRAGGEVVGEEAEEDHQREDLEHEPGQRDVLPLLDVVLGRAHARQRAPGRLQDQRGDVAGHQRLVVRRWRSAAGVRTYLYEKPGEVERVIMDDEPARVAHDFQDAAADHARHEPPGAPLDPLQGVGGDGQAEEGDEEDVCRNGRLVLQYARFQRADLESAVRIWAESDGAVYGRHVGDFERGRNL
ncbi:hypothetical protein TruAng_011512 [Truncatella angustata]|nr:hypothetical protein TruAng_011512 [Truncatella angustata]